MTIHGDDKTNRLVIFCFYDADGIVDRYVLYMLEDIKKNCSELFIVCNSILSQGGVEAFKKLTPNILVRENEGLDVCAHKAVLERYGWSRLSEFDEIVMMNDTIMGPVYPFSEMFEEMNGRDVDFWGITKYHKQQINPNGAISYGYTPEHIQSYFIAVRRTMVQSWQFQEYWSNLPEIKSYADAVYKHEAIFTKTFADYGFRWQVYCDTTDIEKFTDYPLLLCPVKMITQYRCPIFKRKNFCNDYEYFINQFDGSQSRALMDYLKTRTSYDTDMIWENILRTQNIASIHRCLNLYYALPLNERQEKTEHENKRVALVMHIYYSDLIECCFNYALSMPEYADIIITTDKEEKAEQIRVTFDRGCWNNVNVITVENRGRDVSALLVAAAPYLSEYDLVCFAHDKKSQQLKYGISGICFFERSFKNTLGSRKYVENIIDLFGNEPRLGIACPPPPNHAEYFANFSTANWTSCYGVTKDLYDKLGLKCPIDEQHAVMAPLGNTFWFKPAALKGLIDIKWEYEDFPPEPAAIDATISHAIERLYPFCAQNNGYFSAWVVNDDYARTELNNLEYMLSEISRNIMVCCPQDNYIQLVNEIVFMCEKSSHARWLKLKSKIKSHCSPSIWRILKKTYYFLGGREKWVG